MPEMIREWERAFLQTLMSRRCLDYQAAEAFYKSSCQNFNASGTRDFKSTLKNINLSLRDMNIELRGLKLGEDEFVGVINKSSDDLAKAHACRLKEWEIAFFKEVVAALASSPNKKMTTRDLTNLAIKGFSIAIKDKDDFLIHLENEQWLKQDDKGYIIFGPRSYLELSDLLRSYEGMNVPQLIYF